MYSFPYFAYKMTSLLIHSIHILRITNSELRLSDFEGKRGILCQKYMFSLGNRQNVHEGLEYLGKGQLKWSFLFRGRLRKSVNKLQSGQSKNKLKINK